MFFVRGAGVAQRTTSGALVATADLPATFASLRGRTLQGMEAFLGAAPGQRGSGVWRRRVLIENPGNGWYMLRVERHVYVEHEGEGRELHDMDADPYQVESLHADLDQEALVAELSAELAALTICLGYSCRGFGAFSHAFAA